MTGEELKQARLEARYTQKKLGEELGYTGRSAENVVQLWEYNKQPIPIKHYRKLSELLHVPLERMIP